MSTEDKSYYEILQCKPTDSIATIKRSYQTLLLRHHPDKQMHHNRSNDEKNDNSNELSVQKIDEAWKVLRDPESRKTYDAEIQQRKYNDKPIVHEILTSNEFDRNSESFVRNCRCGGYFVIPDELIIENEIRLDSNEDIFIGCDECSLVVQLTNMRN